MISSPRPDRGDLRAPLDDAGGLLSLGMWLGVGLLGGAAILAAFGLLALGGPLWDRDRRAFNAIAAWWGRSVLKLFPGSVELRGMDRLSGQGAVILAPNHQSMVDLLVLFYLPVGYRTVVKRGWFTSPFGLNMWGAGYIPTPKRGDLGGGQRVLARCADWLERGVSVLMFPEGTRARTWSLLRFKRGPFELAHRTGRPIVPVAVAGTNDVSHPSSLRFSQHPRRIIVEALAPISPTDDPEILQARCRQALAEGVAALRAELVDKYGQGPIPDPSVEAGPGIT